MSAIVPTSITNFTRTDDELQRFWLFGILVAGKDADWAAHKVGALLKHADDRLPFEYLREHQVDLHNVLVANRVGQYGRIERAIRESLDLDLRCATVDELQVFGVGPKTARFFVLHSRPGATVAVLDVHILRWLRDHHGLANIPHQTPPEPRYSNIERLALFYLHSSFPGLSVAEADLLIWARMSGRLDEGGEHHPTLPGGAL